MQNYKLRKNRSGYYEIRWSEQLPDGTWRSRTCSTREKGRAAAQAFAAAWSATLTTTPSSTDLTFGDLLDKYLSERQLASRSQEKGSAWIRRYFGALPADSITRVAVREFRSGRLTGAVGVRPVSSGTVAHELGILGTVLRWGAGEGYISETAVPRIDKPRQGAPRDVWLTEAQEAELLQLAAETSGDRMSRIHRFVVLALNTAARREAIERLRWAQVDFDAGVIDYRPSKETVTGKRRVVVPISDRLLPDLERAYRERTSPWVLDTPGCLLNQFKAWIKSTPYPHVRPHDLRRTWATLAARAGVPMWSIAGVLGDTVEVVAKHYTHHSPDHLRDAINRRSAA